MSQQAGGPEGWREDPFGRHELRFWDGARWTPYVRDGESHAVDEPVGAMSGDAVSTVLTEELLVVEQDDSGRRSDRAVRRGDGTTVALLRAATATRRPATSLRSRVVKEQFKAGGLELVDEHGRVVLTFLRPIGDPKATVVVRGGDGRDVGRIVRRGAGGHDLLSAQSVRLGELKDSDGGGLEALDSGGRPVAALVDGSARLDPSLTEPLRTLVVAALVAHDAALRA